MEDLPGNRPGDHLMARGVEMRGLDEDIDGFVAQEVGEIHRVDALVLQARDGFRTGFPRAKAGCLGQVCADGAFLEGNR